MGTSNIKMINKGNLLEDFSEALLGSLSGFVIRYKRAKAKKDKQNPEHDYDLIIQNSCPLFAEFGTYILVECKDWNKPVGYPEIAKFLHKLHSRKCTTGILIATKNAVYKDFNPTLKRTFDQDGIAVIVLDKLDLQKIMDDKINMASLLRKKYEEVRFGLI